MKNKKRFGKKIGAIFIVGAMALGSVTFPVMAAPADASAQNLSAVTAFPGAEGGGMYTTGARGAWENGEKIQIYHVTNLNDSGDGSFRDAVSAPNRIVVFDVSGYIDLKSNVSIGKGNITVLGQTAPGGGICFRGDNIKVGSDNVILRYLRFRVGAKHADGTKTAARDGLEITDDCQNVIIDHCSVSWGTDENLSAYAVKDVTIQNCIISEALNQSVHDKGEHSYGAIWGGVNLTVHHNLIASHKSRNPKIGTSETVAMTAGYTDAQTLVDIRNNVIYNWSDKAGYGTENGAKTYLQNNIYKPGPATGADAGSDEIKYNKRSRIFELSVGQKYKKDYLGSVYAKGNFVDQDPDDPDYENARKVNENNWQDDLGTGVYVDRKVYATADKSNMVIETPDEQYQTYERDYPIGLDSVEETYEKVLTGAGATLPRRDLTDVRVIENVRNRTAPNDPQVMKAADQNGDSTEPKVSSKGLVDDPLDAVPKGQESLYDDRGYALLAEESRDSDYDTDKDGIPDVWETQMGLDPANPLDSTKRGPDGYTWLEIYVETAVTNPQTNQITLKLAAFDKPAVHNTESVSFSAELVGGNAENVAKVQFYCGDTVAAEAVQAENGVFRGMAVKLDTGDQSISAKAVLKDGSYVLSNIRQLIVNGSQTAADWTAAGGASYDGDAYILSGGSSYTRTASGDFKLVGRIDAPGDRVMNAPVTLGGSSFAVGKMYNDRYEPVVVYKTQEGDYQIWNTENPEQYNLFEITRTGNTIKLYAGTSLADLEETLIASASVSGSELTLSAAAAHSEQGVAVWKLGILKLVVEASHPQIRLSDSVGSRLWLSGSSAEVQVTPDGFPVTEIWLYLNGKVVASQKTSITGQTTVTLPLHFDGAQRGELTAFCFDENICSGTDARNVTVTQDLSPWTLTEIGADAGTADTAFVSGTDDYTYKISGIGGSICTDEQDRFAYLNQQFTGNIRMYYRSRMQGSSQFGVVFRSNLSSDHSGAAYYFGGVKEGDSLKYQLRKCSAGSESPVLIKDVTDITGSSATLYFIAEKAGDTINIYQTENGGTIYRTKTPLASVPCADLGDTYYMGFGAVDGGSSPSDAGWIALESFGSDTDEENTYISGYDGETVRIHEGTAFAGGTVIACGYSRSGELLTMKQAQVENGTASVGAVAGDVQRLFLWNSPEGMVPLCEPYEGVWSAPGQETIWSFDNDLDWLWQLQERNVLCPVWTEETVGGNATGKMQINTTGEYASERYIFREYQTGSDGADQVIRAYTDVLLAGDAPGISIYLNVGSKDQAFKVTFGSDGAVSFGDMPTEYIYNTQAWYRIEITCDTGADPNSAHIVLRDADGGICAENEAVPIGEFRSQIHTAKKTPVTNALFYEPAAGKTASYYVDNAGVKISASAVQKTVLASHFWNFGASEEFSGLTALVDGGEYAGLHVIGGAAVEGGRNKTIDGILFPSRYKIGGAGSTSSKCVYFDVPAGTTDIVVYGEPAGSSGVRSVVINDGTEHKTVLTTQMSAAWIYTGDARRIYIYGDAGINLYGISYETYTYTGN